MSLKIVLKLMPMAKPHLYLNDIKELMKDDDYLHPLMKNTLLLMKKTRMPYIVLAITKEIIYIPEKHMHLERALEPKETGWSRIEWSESEIKTFKESPEDYWQDILKLYNRLGYIVIEKEELAKEMVDELDKMTQKQVKK